VKGESMPMTDHASGSTLARETSGRHQVLVVGGGFGGVNVAKALAHADADVTIADRTNHHLFQPLLAEATGAETDRAGRVVVLPDCTLPRHPEVFAIGDMVSLNKLPGVAQPAIQEGRYVGKVIRARLDADENVPPFKYFDKGSMATIGHLSAVTDSFPAPMVKMMMGIERMTPNNNVFRLCASSFFLRLLRLSSWSAAVAGRPAAVLGSTDSVALCAGGSSGIALYPTASTFCIICSCPVSSGS